MLKKENSVFQIYLRRAKKISLEIQILMLPSMKIQEAHKLLLIKIIHKLPKISLNHLQEHMEIDLQ